MSERDDDRLDEASVKLESERLIAELVERGARAIGISEDAPTEVSNAFLRQVLASETGATTTLLKELQRIGIDVPSPSGLSDDALTARLWEVINGLASLRVFLEFTDHLSDRALYERLHGELLPEEMDPLAIEDGGVWHVSIIGGCSTEDNLIYLKYYADEEERREWQAAQPGEAIPAHDDLPYDRDRLLPAREW